ncbi:unnamed protein product [Rhizophagus irregularis]|nr:unnamed protein product [Rhizophagus irregularis]
MHVKNHKQLINHIQRCGSKCVINCYIGNDISLFDRMNDTKSRKTFLSGFTGTSKRYTQEIAVITSLRFIMRLQFILI